MQCTTSILQRPVQILGPWPNFQNGTFFLCFVNHKQNKFQNKRTRILAAKSSHSMCLYTLRDINDICTYED